MYKISEIAPDVYRISVFVSEFNLQFNHFLIKDDEPMLYHTGMRQMFPQIREAVTKIIDPSLIRWIGFSHFEVDECGSLNEWLNIAPNAQAVCSEVGALVNMGDFSSRPARPLSVRDKLHTGKYSYSFIPTPHLPHGWDAGVLFEETNKTLFCSDLFHQNGEVKDVTDKDILQAHKEALLEQQKSPLMDYSPYTVKTPVLLKQLANLAPTTLATMHGSSYRGNGSKLLLDLDSVMKEVWEGR